MASSEDATIVAQATPIGYGGVGVVRISGPLSQSIARQIIGRVPPIRMATYSPFLDSEGGVCDQGIALFFEAPHSFTGEDVLELQGHGGPVVIENLIQAVLKMGARLAEPGEFSLRAFLNHKIDLVQAEAVADLIQAHSLQAARGALRSLQGDFSKAVTVIVDLLTKHRMFIEAMIDFPEEEIQMLETERLFGATESIQQQLKELIAKANQGLRLREGAQVLIMGLPNAGKSSLLNCLSEQEHAIVTPIPGTTRDIVRASCCLEGLVIDLVDTAGLRESTDPIEQEGIRRALDELKRADHVIWMVDATEDIVADPQKLYAPWSAYFKPDIGMTIVYNKIDVLQKKSLQPPAAVDPLLNKRVWNISVKTGAGLDVLKQHLKKVLRLDINTENNFSARTRHIEGLLEAQKTLETGIQQFKENDSLEFLAEHCRLAQKSLEVVTGRFSSDDLLGKIFSEFCIGK